MSEISACAVIGPVDGINQATAVAIPELSEGASRPRPVAMVLKPAGDGHPNASIKPEGK